MNEVNAKNTNINSTDNTTTEKKKRPVGRQIRQERLVENHLAAKIITHDLNVSERVRLEMAGYSPSFAKSQNHPRDQVAIYKEKLSEFLESIGGSVGAYTAEIFRKIENGEHKTESLSQNVRTLQTLINMGKALVPTVKQKTVNTDEQGNKTVIWQTING